MDLRSCVYTGKNLADKVLSGALVSDADFSKTVMSNVTMTKSYAKGANFSGRPSATVKKPSHQKLCYFTVPLECAAWLELCLLCTASMQCPAPKQSMVATCATLPD